MLALRSSLFLCSLSSAVPADGLLSAFAPIIIINWFGVHFRTDNYEITEQPQAMPLAAML